MAVHKVYNMIKRFFRSFGYGQGAEQSLCAMPRVSECPLFTNYASFPPYDTKNVEKSKFKETFKRLGMKGKESENAVT